MKKITVLLMTAVLCIMGLYGCSSGVAGTYKYRYTKTDPSELVPYWDATIKIKSDKTFTAIRVDNDESENDVIRANEYGFTGKYLKGSYEVVDKKITFKYSAGKDAFDKEINMTREGTIASDGAIKVNLFGGVTGKYTKSSGCS